MGKPLDRLCLTEWVAMTSMNGPSARDAAAAKTVRDAGAADGQSVTRTQFLNGELPAVRVGRSFRVHAKAVHDLLETSYFDAG